MRVLTAGTARACIHDLRFHDHFLDDQLLPTPHLYFLYFVVGFAADGFPIYGGYFNDNGTIRRAQSSHQLRSGSRVSGPGGTYDGTFIDDYEFVSGSGDLDDCNGMIIDGSYGYYITEGYPYLLACFRGAPDDSFLKRR